MTQLSSIEQRKPLLISLLLIWSAALFISGLQPFDQAIWLMEVFPALVGVAVLIATRRKFPFTTLVYLLVLVHSIILMVGGHYTYARTPLGEWLKDWFGFTRNNYDRLGHLAQGFIPAIIAREILIRVTPLKPGGWLNYLTVTVCMSISVIYEFIEWWSALALGQGADEFLATQGDIWDTQWDMFYCTVGAILALLTLSSFHNRAINQLQTGLIKSFVDGK